MKHKEKTKLIRRYTDKTAQNPIRSMGQAGQAGRPAPPPPEAVLRAFRSETEAGSRAPRLIAGVTATSAVITTTYARLELHVPI